MDCSLPGSSIHGIFQTRILEWVAISSSRGSSRPKHRTCVSCLLHWQVDSLPPALSWKPQMKTGMLVNEARECWSHLWSSQNSVVYYRRQQTTAQEPIGPVSVSVMNVSLERSQAYLFMFLPLPVSCSQERVKVAAVNRCGQLSLNDSLSGPF